MFNLINNIDIGVFFDDINILLSIVVSVLSIFALKKKTTKWLQLHTKWVVLTYPNSHYQHL